MIRHDLADLRRFAVASVGAVLLSATCIAGAIAPARAAETPALAPNAPLTVADWQAAVGDQLDAKLRMPAAGLAGHDHLVAAVDVSFDRDGGFTTARIARSSGNAAVDTQLVRIAGRIAYPALPQGYRGRSQTVTLQAYFAEAAGSDEAARHAAAARALANSDQPRAPRYQTAALPSG